MDWEITANHYLALPAISGGDGGIHGASILHRGMAGLVAWSGSRSLSPEGPPLLRVRVSVNGEFRELQSVRWERLDRWIPRLSADAGAGVRVAITFCTPGGFDPLVRGGVIAVAIENGGAEAQIEVSLEGNWQWTLRTVASTRALASQNRLVRGARIDGVVLEAGEQPNGAALAIGVGGAAGFVEASAGESALLPFARGDELHAMQGKALRFRIGAVRRVGNGRRFAHAFYLGVGPERDGALTTAERLSSLGWEELLRKARLDLASLHRASEESVAREIVARNLVFHHYFAAARAIDDDRIYPVLSRSSLYGAAGIYDERAALAWSLPAFILTDPMLARELLIRSLELWSDRAGLLYRYVDGAVLDGSFSLGRLCDYATAIEHYVDVARDANFAEEPLVRQILHELDDACWERLNPEIFLAATEVLPGGERADHPYCSFDNVMLWRFCRSLAKLWPASPAVVEPGARGPALRLRNAEEEVHAAFWQRFTTEVDGLQVIACTSDLSGHTAVYDDPAGSLRLLPYFGFCAEDDPIWSNTMELLHSPAYPLWLGTERHPGLAGRSRPREASFAALCSDLLSTRRAAALETLRSLELLSGVACETWNPETGRVASGPYAAALAGYLVWALQERRDRQSERREKRR